MTHPFKTELHRKMTQPFKTEPQVKKRKGDIKINDLGKKKPLLTL